VDTDQIIPARFLKVTERSGLAEHLFTDWRQDPDFILNQAEAEGAEILLSGDNFGCGSSREHAPWALTSWGFRAVISTSFADIFKNNALKNGLIPIAVDPATHKELFEARDADPTVEIEIDLREQTLKTPAGCLVRFPIDAFAKHCLLNGMDQLQYLMSFEDRIAAHEATSS